MTFVELVETVSAESGLPKATVSKVLRSFISQSNNVLKSGESIVLPSLGTLYVKKLPARSLFGGTRMSEGGDRVRFRRSRRNHG